MAFFHEQGRADGEDFRTRVALGDITPNQVMPQAVRSMVKFAKSYEASANYTLAAGGGAWVNVDTANLSFPVVLSGAPMELELSLTATAAAGTDFRASFTIDGTEITSGALGIIYLDPTVGAITTTGKYVVQSPPPGPRIISVVWQGGGAGTITIYGAPSEASVTAIAREL